MPDLRELQGLFWRSIAGPRLEPALLAVSEPSATLGADGRLQVYADAYLSRLHDVLAEDFPRLAAIIGHERFAELAHDYVRSHPSRHPSLRHLGRDLAAVMAGRADVPPYCADLARLEWARVEVFDAPDGERLSAGALRAVRPEDWPQLRFAPIPALAILRADWPVHEVWATGAGDVAAAPTVVRVWRGPDYRIYHTPMEARDAGALDRLMAGQPFEVVCTPFDDLPPLEGAQRATALLARWLEDGIIARVR